MELYSLVAQTLNTVHETRLVRVTSIEILEKVKSRKTARDYPETELLIKLKFFNLQSI
jgi:hypothetical protein